MVAREGAAMQTLRVEPFAEPDGRTTWAVREYLECEGYYRRQIVSWHETREEAEAALPPCGPGESDD